MDKFNQLLNETTIVDFRLLWKLSVRYRSHLVFAVILFCAIFSYNYYSQPIIYAVNVPIKAISNHTVSHDLSALLPVDNANNVNLSELKISLESYSFLNSYAELILKEPGFDKFNFGVISTNKNIYGYELKKRCNANKECLLGKLANQLKGSFFVEQGLTENRFVLTLNAIDQKTVLNLAKVLVKAIEINRIYVRQYLVLKEIESVGNLIAESRSIMTKMDGFKALEDQEKLQNNIADLKERIRMLQSSISMEVANVTALASRLAENKRSTHQSRAVSSRDDFEKIQKAQARLNDVKMNITTLLSIPESNRSSTDNYYIAQLKEEKTRLLKLLPAESTRKSMELSENFIEGQRVKSGDYEFDYQVAKNKLDKLNSDYENSKTELNELQQVKIANENKVVSLKTDMDFLKNLESKQLSLKLLNATMNSDLFFEDLSPSAREFRQSTYIKIFLFSFSIVAFFYFISILIRFLLDDRIYGEDDVRSHLKGLDFVGEVPFFDQ